MDDRIETPPLSAPDPGRLYPLLYDSRSASQLYRHGIPVEGQRVVFLKSLIHSPFTSVGDFTYYDDPDDPTGFERRNLLFHYGPQKLLIGKYCALAQGTRFVMSPANHRMTGISTFPFPLLGARWLEASDMFMVREPRGDTVVGNDVWFGYDALVMPGVHIGDGAIVGARAVVTTDVPPYGIVAGNPARLVRRRFSDTDVEVLLRVKWWDWPVEVVTRHMRTIMANDIDALVAVARQEGFLADDVRSSDDPRVERHQVTSRS